MRKNSWILLLIMMCGTLVFFVTRTRTTYYDSVEKALREELTLSTVMDLDIEDGDNSSDIELTEWTANYRTIDDDVPNKEMITSKLLVNESNVVGILKIPSLDFEQVIMSDVTPGDLDVSVGVVNLVNTEQNISIAGHRSDIEGRHFNRLHEIANGKSIFLQTHDGDIYQYRVMEKFIVKSSETWVLEPFSLKETLTLITCTKDADPFNRLIVRAVLVE